MQHLIRFFLLILITGGFGYMLDTPLKEGLISTLYNVSGIMFSIGLGLIVTFNLSGIRNREYIKEIRKNIANIRNIFISYFATSTLIYITYSYIEVIDFRHKSFYIKIESSIFACVLLLFSIMYFTINFLSIQKLNDEIFDRITEEQEQK